MIKINMIIDMEMPKTCCGCRFANTNGFDLPDFYEDDTIYCTLTKANVEENVYRDTKHDECPLQKIED